MVKTDTIQTITSRKTSVRKIPAPYTNLEFKSCSIIYDYGCGVYFDDIVAYMRQKDVSIFVLGWDKYNYNNQEIYEMMHLYSPDYIICSCVPNVIKEKEVIISVLKDIYSIAGVNTEIIFNIYEGDKSEIGKETRCGYQRNMKTRSYQTLLCEWFDIVKIKGNLIECRKVV